MAEDEQERMSSIEIVMVASRCILYFATDPPPPSPPQKNTNNFHRTAVIATRDATAPSPSCVLFLVMVAYGVQRALALRGVRHKRYLGEWF